MSLTNRERSAIVNDLRLYDQMEADILAELSKCKEAKESVSFRALAAYVEGDEESAEYYSTMAAFWERESIHQRDILSNHRLTMRRVEAELAP